MILQYYTEWPASSASDDSQKISKNNDPLYILGNNGCPTYNVRETNSVSDVLLKDSFSE